MRKPPYPEHVRRGTQRRDGTEEDDMNIQRTTRRILLAVLGLSLSTMVACASLNSASFRGVAVCPGCDRVVQAPAAR